MSIVFFCLYTIMSTRVRRCRNPGANASTARKRGDGAEASAQRGEEIIAEQIFEQLNERAASKQQAWPLFFVPGAGMQSGGFRALAALLPLPVYGASWPRGLRPRAEWPATLGESRGAQLGHTFEHGNAGRG